MKKRIVKHQIINDTLKIDLNDNNIDEIYDFIPKLIKLCNKKYYVILKYKDEEIKDDSYIKKKILENNKIIDIIEVVHAINIKDINNKYNYIYDTVCAKLDERIKTNYCEFKDGVCIKYRIKNPSHKNGCCECKGRGRCKYLIDGVCTMKSCMACKLFTCHTLKKKGITQSINDFVLTKYFFNSKEKDILQFSYWTPKEIVMERLIERVK